MHTATMSSTQIHSYTVTHSTTPPIHHCCSWPRAKVSYRTLAVWNRQYEWKKCLEQFNSNNGIPRRFAYTHTLIDGPSVHNHPLWREATSTTKDMGRKKPTYHRRQTSTVFQLAVDHAFTGSYAKRFRPLDPPDSHACECGHPMRDPDHLIRHCPLLTPQRRDADIQTNFDTYSLRDVFNKFPHRLFAFLQTPSCIYQPLLPWGRSGGGSRLRARVSLSLRVLSRTNGHSVLMWDVPTTI